jgi:hypothetical protein
LLGDYNQDGTVDMADYCVWRDTLGEDDVSPFSGADGDGNGSIGPADYSVWKSQFGETLPLGGMGSIVQESINTEQVVATTPTALELPASVWVTINDQMTARNSYPRNRSRPRYEIGVLSRAYESMHDYGLLASLTSQKYREKEAEGAVLPVQSAIKATPLEADICDEGFASFIEPTL